MCKKIHRGGNAEQYHADKKYKEAVAEAVEACAEDVKGQTCYAALNFSTSLTDTGNFAEARAFMPDQIALANRVLGSDHPLTLEFQWGYFRAFSLDKDVTAEQLAEPVAGLEKSLKIAQRVLGREHPSTCNYRYELAAAREILAIKRG